jgi:hypothetical protein
VLGTIELFSASDQRTKRHAAFFVFTSGQSLAPLLLMGAAQQVVVHD